ncbi:hypothetical protein ACROYT_G018830 [Oculina patagonica]
MSWRKEMLLQRTEPNDPPTSHRRGPTNISVIRRGTASTVIKISETAMLTMRPTTPAAFRAGFLYLRCSTSLRALS